MPPNQRNRTTPAFPEGVLFESRGEEFLDGLSNVTGFSFCRGNVPDRRQQSFLVEPIYPTHALPFDFLDAAPRSSAVNDLGLV